MGEDIRATVKRHEDIVGQKNKREENNFHRQRKNGKD